MPEEDLHSLLDSIISIPISDWVLFENIADTQVLAPKPKQYFLFYITKLNSKHKQPYKTLAKTGKL